MIERKNIIEKRLKAINEIMEEDLLKQANFVEILPSLLRLKGQFKKELEELEIKIKKWA